MNKRRMFAVFVFFTLLFVGLFSAPIKAREELSREQVKDVQDNLIGSITLYDDYSLVFDYSYRLSDIEVYVCEIECTSIDLPVHKPGTTFIGGGNYECSLSDYIENDTSTRYKVIGQAYFKAEGSTISNVAMLEYTIKVSSSSGAGNSKSRGEQEYNEEVEKTLNVINTWVLPGVYIAAGVAIVINSILMAVDLIKYSDNPEIRKNKLTGIVYAFIGIGLLIAINSLVGVVTGLFDM